MNSDDVASGSEVKLMDSEIKDVLLYSLQREDNLINNRLIWVLTFQGFLFAVAAISFTGGKPPEYFISAVASLGAFTSGLGVFLSIWGNGSILKIRNKWSEYDGYAKEVSPFTSVQNNTTRFSVFFGLSVFMPLSICVAWLWILCKSGIIGAMTSAV